MKKNETLMQYFEWDLPADSLHWKRCKAKAKELKEAGITAVWLPPAYKGMKGKQDVGYGVYDIYDLGEFEQKGSVPTKYGKLEEYLAAIKELKKQDIRVYADVVLNHMMGADGCEKVRAVETAENNRLQNLSGLSEITAWTKFDFPGRKGKYCKDTWDKSLFSGTDWDENRKKKALYLFEGKQWDEETDKEKNNYDYLMGADVDMDHPMVYERFLTWGKWYIKKIKIDSFRLDAVKHINASFYEKWIKDMRKAFPEEELSFVGEYWHSDLQRLLRYLAEVDYEMALFDVPLHFNFYNASREQSRFDMRYLFANSLTEERPENAVSFVDNHDTQPGQALQSYVDGWFKPIAYAVILLRKEGIPCVFYGDYYGLPSHNIPPVLGLPVLMKLREKFAYGEQVDYFDHPNVIGFVRKGSKEWDYSGMAVLLSDGPGGEKRMHLGEAFAGTEFYDCVGKCRECVIIDENGWGTFRCDGGSVSVWVMKEAYEYLRINV